MNLANLKADINFLCGSTSATYADTDKVRNMNIAYQDVARIIWGSAGEWQYSDNNNTSAAIAKTNLSQNVQDVTLPVTIQRVRRVEVKDNGGIWHKLQQIDINNVTDIAMPEYQKSPGLPIYYDLHGQSVSLYPAPASASVTLSSGIAFYVDKDVIEFAVTATTTNPGFPSSFHRILSYAAAIDFTQDPQLRQSFVAQKARLEAGLSRFYAARNIERMPAIRPKSKRNWRKYT